MSVVAVSIHDDQIDIAADSQVTFGSNFVSESKPSKLFDHEGFVVASVGAAADISMMQIFMKSHKPESADEEGILKYIHEFRTWMSQFNGAAPDPENEYIFIVGNKVFWEGNYYVKEVEDYFAMGSGTDFSLAALYLGHNVKEAVEAACAHSVYCSLPAQSITVRNTGYGVLIKEADGDEG